VGGAVSLSPLGRKLLNRYQAGFPRTSRPFAMAAEVLGSCETAVLLEARKLTAQRVLGRIGSVTRAGSVGASTLAAMAVPPARLEAVAALINEYPEVNHNYARDDRVNLWFVVVAPNEDRLRRVLDDIEARTGGHVLRLPLEEAYHIDLGFAL